MVYSFQYFQFIKKIFKKKCRVKLGNNTQCTAHLIYPVLLRLLSIPKYTYSSCQCIHLTKKSFILSVFENSAVYMQILRVPLPFTTLSFCHTHTVPPASQLQHTPLCLTFTYMSINTHLPKYSIRTGSHSNSSQLGMYYVAQVGFKLVAILFPLLLQRSNYYTGSQEYRHELPHPAICQFFTDILSLVY